MIQVKFDIDGFLRNTGLMAYQSTVTNIASKDSLSTTLSNVINGFKAQGFTINNDLNSMLLNNLQKGHFNNRFKKILEDCEPCTVVKIYIRLI